MASRSTFDFRRWRLGEARMAHRQPSSFNQSAREGSAKQHPVNTAWPTTADAAPHPLGRLRDFFRVPASGRGEGHRNLKKQGLIGRS